MTQVERIDVDRYNVYKYFAGVKNLTTKAQ